MTSADPADALIPPAAPPPRISALVWSLRGLAALMLTGLAAALAWGWNAYQGAMKASKDAALQAEVFLQGGPAPLPDAFGDPRRLNRLGSSFSHRDGWKGFSVEFDVTGPKGAGRVDVGMVPERGGWSPRQLHVVAPDGRQTLVKY